MKVITVPTEDTFFYHLLTAGVDNGLILQTTDGHRFMLWSLEDWEGFDVGESDDFGQEVEATSRNTQLMTLLAERRRHGRRIPLETLKEELGLDS
ncbi:hypothetical protein U27_02186 [Candidatus Vecturithrix granuli]|uniref:Uncharacterized protein n=1 Tax=Vecturithrix granuli TaxID=1499967 RepID=A0A0S6WAN7_VECG1|nr:hypothetical protein U27_02186 [Candidatus Vecturithrix granuli]